MDIQETIIILDALSQETRLKTLRLLIKAGKSGLSAGHLSESLNVPHNTLSFHLNHLSNAGAITSKRNGRSIIYSADFTKIHSLIEFLIQDCCSSEFAHIKENKKNGNCIIELTKCC